MSDEVNIDQLKVVELQLFDAFSSVCKQLNLKYFALGGTLLGAVRHKGFIPWDDDIDLGMLRPDYDVFLEKGQKLLPNNIFIQTYRTDPEYPLYFTKLRKSDTTFIESSVSGLHMNHGVFLDVFPLDFYPENKTLQVKWDWHSKLINARLSQEFIDSLQRKIVLKEKIMKMISKRVYNSSVQALERCDKLLKEMPESNFLRNYFGAWGKKEIWPVEWFGSGTILEFEDRMIICPKEWDKLLRSLYGNYKELPPEEERIPHHFTTHIDLDHSYLEY